MAIEAISLADVPKFGRCGVEVILDQGGTTWTARLGM